ncbi:MAG TPA: DUF5689 domain-containing protein [Flavobacterium sp.]|jgi:hypothetical protein
MKSKVLRYVFSIALAASLTTGCINDEHTVPESGIVTYNLTANTTVAAVVAASRDIATPYIADDIIEGYVTSNDENGNFFNTITFQTIPTDGSAPIGFSIAAELKAFQNGFTPGRKVFIKLKGLYTAYVDGSLKIGSLFETTSIGRIAAYNWRKHIFLSSMVIDENSFVRTFTLLQAATDENINTLIELNNVQFTDGSMARTYYDINSGGNATNHNISEVNGTTSRFLRVSRFALFSSGKVPSGRGKIRGIMSKYGSDFQFLIRSENDVKLTNPRTYNFVSSLNEGFQTATVNQKIFTNYLNFATAGTKDWIVKSGNFLEMSAFGGNVENNKSYFIIPVNMTVANTFSFQVKAQFYNGSALKVYRTLDYVPGMKLSNATLFDITTSFSLPNANTSTFASAGTYTIPANITGNGYFVFEYTGTNSTAGPVITTTIQIDNIVIN